MSTAPTIRLIIADDHEVVLTGLEVLISRHRSLECVGSATNGYEAVDLATRLRPDVVLMDLTMPTCDGLEATRRLGKHVPDTRVLAFSMRPAASMVLAALRAGALGYVSKSSHHNVLIGAIPVVAKGKRFIDPHLTDPMLRTLLDDQLIGAPSTLSKREREVLLRVAWGFTNNDIGGDLGLSTKTVESYRTRACEKLALADRPAIVKFAHMSGWLDEEAS
jgi:two-component system, NarL family, response regulator NreC